MLEYFGSFSFIVVSVDEIEVEVEAAEGMKLEKASQLFPNISKEQQFMIIQYQIIPNLKSKINWNKFDIIFLDYGNGSLHILKDNTSKFSVPSYSIQT